MWYCRLQVEMRGSGLGAGARLTSHAACPSPGLRAAAALHSVLATALFDMTW